MAGGEAREPQRPGQKVGRGEQRMEIICKVQQALELLIDMGGGIRPKC